MKKIGDIAKAIAPPFESCGNCSKDGWTSRILYDGHPCKVRCQCWKAHQARIAQALKDRS